MIVTVRKTQFGLIIVGIILSVMGFVAVDPEFATRTGRSATNMGMAFLFLGIPLFFYGFVYPYVEAWREKKLSLDMHCPHCGKLIQSSKFLMKRE